MRALILLGILCGCKAAETILDNPDEVCNLKPIRGMCKALMPRFYYDVGDKTCKEFSYGGCGGNKNNFLRVEDCYNYCIKSITPVSVTYQIQKPEANQKTTSTPSYYSDTLQNPTDSQKIMLEIPK
ncbi:hypothetical protein SNE40_010631 [Patella caerulea]|uniref:BPTI/Kunitz inhibitor domain-containing protein n=1 Tax=Patella caerulea TaxID=87958 RepID=A0AAN8JUV5_PATCE